MPVFEWNNETRAGKAIAFVNVEAGLQEAPPSRKRLEQERGKREEAEKRASSLKQDFEKRETALKQENEKLETRASNAEENLGETRRQLHAFKRNRFRLENPEPEQSRVQTFKSLLAPIKGERLLDLGCGHGKFSLAAGEMGWKVTGVDARTERMPDKEGRSIEWVQSDVREYSFSENDFDCIAVLGLLYHLEQPAQMELLSRCAKTPTILDTRVGLDQKASEGGYRGSYYEEPGESEEERKTKLAASWGNASSFWPTEQSLIRMCRDAGFSLVAPVRPPRKKYRTFYVCYP